MEIQNKGAVSTGPSNAPPYQNVLQPKPVMQSATKQRSSGHGSIGETGLDPFSMNRTQQQQRQGVPMNSMQPQMNQGNY